MTLFTLKNKTFLHITGLKISFIKKSTHTWNTALDTNKPGNWTILSGQKSRKLIEILVVERKRQHCPVQWQTNQNTRIARKKGRNTEFTFTFSPQKLETHWKHKNDPCHCTFDLERWFSSNLENKDSSRCAETRWKLRDKSVFLSLPG